MNWLLLAAAVGLFWLGGLVGMLVMAALVVSKGDRFDEGYFAGVQDSDDVTFDGIPIIRYGEDIGWGGPPVTESDDA